MTIIDLVPKICKLFPGITAAVFHIGMICVGYYHQYSENIFFNTSFKEAGGLEKIGNIFLIPSQYLCAGKLVSYNREENTFTLHQRFQYQTHKKIYSPAAFSFFTPGWILGSACKGIALFSPEVKKRHRALKKHMETTEVTLNTAVHTELGINLADWREASLSKSQGYQRRPGDENHLLPDKEALKEIVAILSKEKIPFWVDCGTCIGTFRYGGVIPWDNDIDISILVNDFQNVKNALKRLDSTKFIAQDWSSRGHPDSYIRVFVKESNNHIDIYCNDINPISKTITYIVSHIDSNFMAKDWKERERRQTAPIPFDVIFPLQKGIFDGIEVPIPNQTSRFISYKYGPNIAPPKVYSEQTGRYEKDLSHPYWNVPLAH